MCPSSRGAWRWSGSAGTAGGGCAGASKLWTSCLRLVRASLSLGANSSFRKKGSGLVMVVLKSPSRFWMLSSHWYAISLKIRGSVLGFSFITPSQSEMPSLMDCFVNMANGMLTMKWATADSSPSQRQRREAAPTQDVADIADWNRSLLQEPRLDVGQGGDGIRALAVAVGKEGRPPIETHEAQPFQAMVRQRLGRSGTPGAWCTGR